MTIVCISDHNKNEWSEKLAMELWFILKRPSKFPSTHLLAQMYMLNPM